MLTGNKRSQVRDTSEPPWYRWHEQDPAKRCIRFIETYCRSPKGVGHGQPVKLAQFQKDWITTILAPGIRQAVLQAPRGAGKSTLLAAIAVWATFDQNPTGQPIVPIMATTVGQAARSVYDVVIKMIAAEPELDDRAIVYRAIANTKIVVVYNGGECFPIANLLDGLQGLDPSTAIIDEIGFQPTESWNAMVMASGKRERSLVIGIGTPGVDKERSALWRMRQTYLDGRAPAGFSFTELSAPEGCDVHDESMWLLANPAIAEGYLSIDALRNDVAMMPESQFRLFRLAQFADGVDCWLGEDGSAVWSALHDPYELVPGAPTFVGVDIGLKRDTTAVVIGQRRPDGRLHTVAKIWVPTPGNSIDLSSVMQFLRDLDHDYQIQAMAYDPRLFEIPGQMLADEGLPMIEFPQSIERMSPSYVALYEAIVRGDITHDGDEQYARQILNAIPRFNERGFLLSKNKSRGKIDAAAALAMMFDRAQHPAKPKAPAFVL